MQPMTRTPIDRWGPLPPHAEPPRRRGVSRWLERIFFLIAVVCLVAIAFLGRSASQRFSTVGSSVGNA